MLSSKVLVHFWHRKNAKIIEFSLEKNLFSLKSPTSSKFYDTTEENSTDTFKFVNPFAENQLFFSANKCENFGLKSESYVCFKKGNTTNDRLSKNEGIENGGRGLA